MEPDEESNAAMWARIDVLIERCVKANLPESETLEIIKNEIERMRQQCRLVPRPVSVARRQW